MLLERLLDNLAVDVEPFAVCDVSNGWRLKMDALGWVTLHYVLSGDGKLRTADGAQQPLRQYCLAVVPPRLIHSIETGESVAAETTTAESRADRDGLSEFVAGPRGDDDLVVACGRLTVTYAGGTGLFDLLPEALVIDFSDSEPMRETFERLLDEERSASPGLRMMVTSLMSECLVLVLRRVCESPDCSLPWLEALEDPRLAPVIDAILEHPEHPYTVDSLAAQAYMSRSAFVAQFTSHFSRTPMAFVREVRMRRAAKLLKETELTVDAVASRVGYASRSQFSHAFKEQYRCSPAKYRAELS